MQNRLPPHDLDAEEATIASLLIDGSMFGTLKLKRDDFYSEANGMIYGALEELVGRETSINQITVAQELARQDKLEAVGGASYMSHIISVVPTSMDLIHYAEIVYRLAVCRRLIRASDQIASIGYAGDPDISQALSKADDILVDVRKDVAPSPIVTPEDRASMLSKRYEKLFQIEGGVSIPTGLIDLDRLLGGGLYDGDLLLLGARPGMGKTALMQTIANNIGAKRNVLLCSGEMGIEGMSDRDVAGTVGVPVSQIRLGGYTDEVFAKIIGPALERIAGLNVYYYRDVPLTTAKVMQAGMMMQLRHGLDVLMVDYLGLLDDEYGKNQYERIGFISRKMKHVARVLDVPVLVAHQLSRALELRQDKRPQLFDLRDSGRLEEDADVVLFIYRDNYYEWESEDTTTEIIIAKQRQGEANKIVRVLFDKEHQTYVNLEERR